MIAVTGLAGHAFGSWRNRETLQMWLKDFLPYDIPNLRVLTYGYDSSLVGTSRTDSSLLDYQRNFIQAIENTRSSGQVGYRVNGFIVFADVTSKGNSAYHIRWA